MIAWAVPTGPGLWLRETGCLNPERTERRARRCHLTQAGPPTYPQIEFPALSGLSTDNIVDQLPDSLTVIMWRGEPIHVLKSKEVIHEQAR
jgi:hypothetical protein